MTLVKNLLARLILFLYKYCSFEFDEKYEEKYGEQLGLEISLLNDEDDNKANICIELDQDDNTNIRTFWSSRDNVTLNFFVQSIYTFGLIGMGETLIFAIENGLDCEEDWKFYEKIGIELAKMARISLQEQQQDNPIISPTEVFSK